MFRRIDLPLAERPRIFSLQVEGRPIQAREGESLAAALLVAGVVPFRSTPVSGAPRAPLCMMGVCFECLVHVDGQQNVQSCAVEVREGMEVRLPVGARAPGVAA
jgi:predicted molibdopterin-dependent oxidoreductase YjgC